jgi:predicted nucleic-acid-binding protein
MRALDTNVLARLLLADDAAQLARVKALMAQKQIFTAPISVMLELVWVLEAHDFDEREIVEAFNQLLALSNFKPANLAELRQALSWYSKGMDFADAVHLAMSDNVDQILTFDKAFIKVAKREGLREAGVDWVAEVG